MEDWRAERRPNSMRGRGRWSKDIREAGRDEEDDGAKTIVLDHNDHFWSCTNAIKYIKLHEI